eukprot:360380-Chlamydomonas_euryale.AAC.5
MRPVDDRSSKAHVTDVTTAGITPYSCSARPVNGGLLTSIRKPNTAPFGESFTAHGEHANAPCSEVLQRGVAARCCSEVLQRGRQAGRQGLVHAAEGGACPAAAGGAQSQLGGTVHSTATQQQENKVECKTQLGGTVYSTATQQNEGRFKQGRATSNKQAATSKVKQQASKQQLQLAASKQQPSNNQATSNKVEQQEQQSKSGQTGLALLPSAPSLPCITHLPSCSAAAKSPHHLTFPLTSPSLAAPPIPPLHLLRSSVLVGTGVGVLATCFNAPFDVIKSRVQSQLPGMRRYHGTFSALATIRRCAPQPSPGEEESGVCVSLVDGLWANYGRPDTCM